MALEWQISKLALGPQLGFLLTKLRSFLCRHVLDLELIVWDFDIFAKTARAPSARLKMILKKSSKMKKKK